MWAYVPLSCFEKVQMTEKKQLCLRARNSRYGYPQHTTAAHSRKKQRLNFLVIIFARNFVATDSENFCRVPCRTAIQRSPG